ncbi:MAG TPA: hypothetical protein VE131_06660 [Terriglobales bacterium]|nr:hypothetical protein [Terriglobales bacterium]
MGLLDRFKRPKRTCHDPIFGQLEFDNQSCWNGTVFFGPTANEIAVAVVTGGPEPDDGHRTLFREICERYGALQPDIARALFDLWEPYRKEWPAESEPPPKSLPRSAEDMLQATQLDYLAIKPGPSFQLAFGFRSDVGWDDAMLSVKIGNWQVSPERLDD